ncbi:MAG TPA: sulfatase-like hydrolase/transferase, partial [Vicinamibacterales bacterium]|nr:sulfatase-like hydrolase/transferase [Vicinamibacterales bacterium]
MRRQDEVTRRTWLRRAGVGTVALASGVHKMFGQPAARRPNIVFILADDLGYADVSCYGRRDLSTPNVDRLAAMGVRFLQAYANSAVCTATRTALITGRYQYRFRVGLEEPLSAAGVGIGLPPQEPTMPSLLKKAGYGTTLVGKWHLGALPAFGPLRSGYDHFYGFRGGAVDYYSHRGTDQKDDLWDDDVAIHQSGYLTDLLGSRAVEAIDGYAKSDRPFFLSLHFNAPHWPWEAPGDEAESDRLKSTNLFHFDGGTQKTYQRMIAQMDLQIGRVLSALEANAVLDDTLVVFTSDNGGERFADTWPFTGRKTELLEGGLRIPAIVSWPARLPKGRTTEQVAISMDWLPTLAAAAGAATDQASPPDGISLLPQLLDPASTVRRTLFWRFKANAQRAARDGDYKFLKILDNTFLFNVVDDPMERANLKERHADIYERLEAAWHEWNATMLPEVDESNTAGLTGDKTADRPGAVKASGKADNPKPA